MSPGDLVVTMSSIGRDCRAGSFLTDLANAASNGGLQAGSIDNVDVWQNDQEVLWVQDNIVFEATTTDPGTLRAMQRFLSEYIAGQADCPKNCDG
jgi:hypothetical protein